jgi:hypothetical protein
MWMSSDIQKFVILVDPQSVAGELVCFFAAGCICTEVGHFLDLKKFPSHVSPDIYAFVISHAIVVAGTKD